MRERTVAEVVAKRGDFNATGVARGETERGWAARRRARRRRARWNTPRECSKRL